MKFIKTVLLFCIILLLILFFSENNYTLDIKVPFTEYTAVMPFSNFSILALFIGSIIGFMLRKSDKREHLVREKTLKEEIKHLKTQKKIYESELKIQNQLQKK